MNFLVFQNYDKNIFFSFHNQWQFVVCFLVGMKYCLTGWFMFEAIIAFIAQLWALIRMIILGVFGYRKCAKK
jgi:hypothetical protein